MITKLAVRGFQSLQNISLELGNITVIVGHSDSGKSALLRALEKASFNESGSSFLTTLGNQTVDKCQVAVQCESGLS